jgi:hypothetical protein
MGLAFGFTKKYKFTVKTEQNSIFLGHKDKILDWLNNGLIYKFLQVFKK